MPWRAKKRDSALRLPRIRRLCSPATISYEVRLLAVKGENLLKYFSNGEVLPPRGIGSQVPSSQKHCIQRIAELALTWNCSDASLTAENLGSFRKERRWFLPLQL
jgi:hypothetical protein